MNSTQSQQQQYERPELVGYNGVGTQNYLMDGNALQIRIDTDGLLKQLHLDLLGVTEDVSDDDKDGIKRELIQTGERLANNKGVQNILSQVRAIVNHATVQGNFKEDEDQEDYMVRARKDLATHLRINLMRYDIKKEDYHGLISMVFRLIELFTTRPLNAGDRNSISSSMSYAETNVVAQPKRRSFLPFLGRR